MLNLFIRTVKTGVLSAVVLCGACHSEPRVTPPATTVQPVSIANSAPSQSPSTNETAPANRCNGTEAIIKSGSYQIAMSATGIKYSGGHRCETWLEVNGDKLGKLPLPQSMSIDGKGKEIRLSVKSKGVCTEDFTAWSCVSATGNEIRFSTPGTEAFGSGTATFRIE